MSVAGRGLPPWLWHCCLAMVDREEEPRLGDFYAACDGQHREFFSSILYEWEEAGQPWMWRERDIVLCIRSAGRSLQLVSLHACSGSTPACLTCDLGQVRIRLGDAEADGLLRRIEEIRGLERRIASDICEILEPGNASGSEKQALRAVVHRLGVHLPGVLAP